MGGVYIVPAFTGLVPEPGEPGTRGAILASRAGPRATDARAALEASTRSDLADSMAKDAESAGYGRAPWMGASARQQKLGQFGADSGVGAEKAAEHRDLCW